MDLPKGIIPKVEETFGELVFAGFDCDKHEFDQDKQQHDKNKLKGRIYNIGSSVQCTAIKVMVPAHVEEKKIEFLTPVKLKNVRMKARAQANYPYIKWYITADDIVEAEKIK